jgi:tyrosine-protein kinase Etk/Wzc
MKRAELSQQFTANHPTMIALGDKRRDLEKEKQRIETQIKNLPITEQKAVQLTRNVTVANDLYTALLNKAQELKVAKAGTVGNVRIIDRALVPVKPVKPNKPVVTVLGLVLGLTLGVFFVFLRKALTRSLSDPDQVEREIGLPIYSVIPFSERQAVLERESDGARRSLLARDISDDPAVESMRSLRTSLKFAMPASEGGVIAFTGPTPEIGKSFVTANLAFVLAQGGSRVLLVDADLHRGRQHRFFGGQRSPGLSEILSGEAEFDKVVRETDVARLDLLATGVIPPNPSELFMRTSMRELLEQANETYDFVLLDTPPVLAVSEAAVLTALASHTFVVMRSAEHTAREIAVCLKRLQRIGVDVRGLVLNGFRPRDAKRYGYGYAYQYEYR